MKTHLLRFIVSAVLTLPFATVFAQPQQIDTINEVTYQFNQLSTERGLIDNRIRDIIQDRAGFIWLAIESGLVRYDGHRYQNYYHNVKIPTSLSSNEITTLLEDSKGRLWVGTSNGLNRQLGHSIDFNRYFSIPESAQTLADNYIVDIAEDKQGRLWVATRTAVNLYDERTGTFARYFFYDSNSGLNAQIDQLVAVGEELYVSSSSGLFRYLRDDGIFYRYGIKDGLPTDLYTATAMSQMDNENLLVALSNGGLFKLAADTGQFTPLTSINSRLKGILETLEISAIYIHPETRQVWLGTVRHGLYILNQDMTDLIKVVSSNADEFSRFELAEIQGIFSDESGLVWIYTRQAGIKQWSSHTLGIEHFGSLSNFTDGGQLRTYIWYFNETPDGQIWVATLRGLMKFDPKTTIYTPVMERGLSYEQQPAIYWIESEQDYLWLATSEGLIKYDYQRDQVETILLNEGLTNTIYSVFLSDKNIYVAVDEVGIIVLDRKTYAIQRTNISPDGIYSGLVDRPVGLVGDDDGSVWILTREGLVNYSPEEDRVRLELSANAEQLSGDRITALFQNGDEYWIGTGSNGINRLKVHDFDKNHYEISQFDDIPELSNLIVNGIIPYGQEQPEVWISTHSGILLLDTANNYIRRFRQSEGMQDREFNEGAYFKDSRGSLYFGGVNGFNRIEAGEFNQSDYDPVLRITDIGISCTSESEECIEADNRLKDIVECEQYGEECDVINRTLPSDLETVSIEYASLDYTLPENNIYRYRLRKSASTPWIETGYNTQLTLSGLSADTYTLEIQGTNFIGEWSSDITSVSFVVARPWYYQNYTFVILFLTIVTSLYFFREIQILRKQEKQRIRQAIRTNEENFKFALWGSGDELWDWNITHGFIRRTNPIQQIDFNNQADQDLSMNDAFAKIHPDDTQRVRNEMTDLVKGNQPFVESVFRVKSKAEGHLWVMCRARVVERDDENNAIRVLGSLKDITLMKATEDKLTLIAQAFENTKEGISVVDSNFMPIFNNSAVYDITGMDQLEALNKQYFFSPESENYSLLKQVKTYLQNFGEWEGEIWERRHDGTEFAMSLKIDKVSDATDEHDYFICVFSDITYKKRSEEELIRLANIDALTGLPNRSLFLDRLSHAIAHARRNSGMFALLFIDLDNFKNVNDTLGHSMGDKMLINIAKRLRSCVRDVDTVARLGGDEFTVILENIHNTNEVGICANKVLKRLSQSMEIDGTLLKSTPSIGIGMYPAHGQDKESLLKNADLAMYSAKEKGKNNYQFFTEDMTSLAMERISIENKLREAIELNQLTLFYQPKVYSVNGEITGFEALVRWIHPEDGMISPGAFIPVAEETGLILSLGDWILEEAIRQASEWSKIAENECQIAINISAKQFMSETFPQRVESLLRQYQVEPGLIELEITEGTLMENMNHTVESLMTLRDMGLHISLDDFGTGYSSLSYLKEFPVNVLKIDQSFVRDVTTDPSDASIVASIITLAHNLGLNVVAEGCETIDQLKFLRAYHCEQVQGYLFSRPLPSNEAEELLRAGKILVE